MSGLRPRIVVGSAAAGADLLALGAAIRAGAEARVVLAGDTTAFRESSVADKGQDWVRRYDALLDDSRVQLEVVERIEDDSEATYRAATKSIWQMAQAARRKDEEVVVVPVSTPRQRGVDHTEELVAFQEAADGVVIRLEPTVMDSEMPLAFVAMPYGPKPFAERDWHEYQADLTYKRILLPALIGAGYHPARADTEALLEIIDVKMLRAINKARVVVADLATLNPNVMWELGVRHAWRPSGTILLAPKGADIPFDVRRIPVHSYERDEHDVSDVDSVAGIRLMQKVLAEVERGSVDSPVFAQLGGLPPVELPMEELEAEQAEPQSAARLLQEVTLAADLGRDERLLALAEEVKATPNLDEELRSPLLEQIAFALIGMRKHDEAAALLAPLAEADIDLSRVKLHEQYAHSLIRSENTRGHEGLLLEAERRLEALIKRGSATGETWGLLGSAAKARLELAVAAGRDALAALEKALHAYLAGFRGDPGAYYPGINALALLRLRGQHLSPNEHDLDEAKRLLPVVRFAVERAGPAVEEDLWAMLTLGECLLHQRLLEGGSEAYSEAKRWYERGAARLRSDQRASARRQLELFRNSGDPPELIDPLLALFLTD
jgi:hypothetical protein